MAMQAEHQPNVLFIMTDQQRFDTIGALGNSEIKTPALDRLVERGVTFTNAYSTCPVCVPARYTLLTGNEPARTGVWSNSAPQDVHSKVRERTGPFLPEVMRNLGYRTFGVGKFHTLPWDGDLGFDVVLHTEEEYADQRQRRGDAFARFIATDHPEYDWIEQLHGERGDMFFMPQMSPLPAGLTVESWVTDRVLEQLDLERDRPWFGLVSFIGPHPPYAPPLPFNRMYDPELMNGPIAGDPEIDTADQYLLFMNFLTYADQVDPIRARVLKSRYYGEITYIDRCIGRILDAVEARDDAEDTMICFFSDHGDLLGDHGSWQKESYFESSTRIPLLISWPAKLPPGKRDELVCLTDLFCVATTAAGKSELREGRDILAVLHGREPGREYLIGTHNEPDNALFKLMVRRDEWKLIYLSNGGKSLLFDLSTDADERHDLCSDYPHVVDELTSIAVDYLSANGVDAPLDGPALIARRFVPWTAILESADAESATPGRRLNQLDRSRGIVGYPADPLDVLD